MLSVHGWQVFLVFRRFLGYTSGATIITVNSFHNYGKLWML